MIIEQITQTVTINGNLARVSGCMVKRSRDQRVGEITFNLEQNASPVAYAAAVLDAEVIVTHAGQSITLSDKGNIFRVDENEYNGILIKSITVRTQEEKLQRVRIRQDWQEELASVVVNDLLTLLGPIIGITAGSISDAGRSISEITGRYDSWFDIMEQISEQTGLAWNVINDQLNLYLPEDIYGPPINSGVFIDGTCNIIQSLSEVFNYVRMQAYEYEYIEILAEPCSVFAKLPIAGPGWELSDEIVKSPHFFPERFKIDFETQEASWKPQTHEAYPFYAKFYARRKVWVQAQDDASIGIYGHREAAPLFHDGGISVPNANLMLDYYLEKKAFPYVSISAIRPNNFGHKPDTFAELSIPGRGLVQDVYISSVTRAMDGPNLIVSMDVATCSGIGRDHNSSLEMMRRIERMERTGLHPAVYQGQPVSHPVISYPLGQTAVKNGDVIPVSGYGTPERSQGDTTVRDVDNLEVPGSTTSQVDYNSARGEILGEFTMGTNTTDFVRLQVILTNLAGDSYAEASRSNALIVDNDPPYDESVAINGGSPTTSSPLININLFVIDGLEMYIDGDLENNPNVRNWIPYTTLIQALCTPALGIKNVSVIFRDGAFNLSPQVDTSIELI